MSCARHLTRAHYICLYLLAHCIIATVHAYKNIKYLYNIHKHTWKSRLALGPWHMDLASSHVFMHVHTQKRNSGAWHVTWKQIYIRPAQYLNIPVARSHSCMTQQVNPCASCSRGMCGRRMDATGSAARHSRFVTQK